MAMLVWISGPTLRTSKNDNKLLDSSCIGQICRIDNPNNPGSCPSLNKHVTTSETANNYEMPWATDAPGVPIEKQHSASLNTHKSYIDDGSCSFERQMFKMSDPITITKDDVLALSKEIKDSTANFPRAKVWVAALSRMSGKLMQDIKDNGTTVHLKVDDY